MLGLEPYGDRWEREVCKRVERREVDVRRVEINRTLICQNRVWVNATLTVQKRAVN